MFKNLQLYRLPSPWAISKQALEDQIKRRVFSPAGSQDVAARGFVPACPGNPGELVFSVGSEWLIALRTEKKLLPAAVIRHHAEARASKLEAEQRFRPNRKQMKEIKEAVEQELRPRALSQFTTTRAWISPRSGWLVVDAASSAKADELIETLREVLAELPLRLVDTEISPTSAMADWLAGGDAPAGFTIDRDCELHSCQDSSTSVRYAHHTLDGDEIPNHLAAGKVPTKLGMTFDGRISFVLTDRLEVKRLAFLDVIQEEAKKAAGAGDEERLASDFALMTGEMGRFLPRLIGALGGERKE